MNTQRLTLWLATGLAALTLLATTACVSSTSTRAHARIVVMPISGSQAANGAVADVVDSRYELVSSKRYTKAARQLDAKSSKSKDIRKVSRKLEIDAIVAGEFVKRGKRKYELRLTLRAGESGKEFSRIRIKVKSKKLSSKDRSKIKNKLYAALSQVDSWTLEATRKRSKRGSSSRSDRERDRARKIREKRHERDRRDDDRRSDRDRSRRDRDEERYSRDERRRAEKDERRRAEKDERRRAEKEERRRAEKDERRLAKRERKRREREEEDYDDYDEDDEDDERSRRSKKKKKKKKNESYEVITVRDTSGQALDEESPF